MVWSNLPLPCCRDVGTHNYCHHVMRTISLLSTVMPSNYQILHTIDLFSAVCMYISPTISSVLCMWGLFVWNLNLFSLLLSALLPFSSVLLLFFNFLPPCLPCLYILSLLIHLSSDFVSLLTTYVPILYMVIQIGIVCTVIIRYFKQQMHTEWHIQSYHSGAMIGVSPIPS